MPPGAERVVAGVDDEQALLSRGSTSSIVTYGNEKVLPRPMSPGRSGSEIRSGRALTEREKAHLNDLLRRVMLVLQERVPKS